MGEIVWLVTGWKYWVAVNFIYCEPLLTIFILYAVTTPNINQLALPFKKREVKSRQQFLGLWSQSKDYVRRASGAKGQYQANKEGRLSEEFPWPVSPQTGAGATSVSPGAGQGQITSSGRGFGTTQYAGYECPAPKRVPPSEEHYILKLSSLRSELKASNLEKAEMKAKLEEKEGRIRSQAKRIVDLERRVYQLGS